MPVHIFSHSRSCCSSHYQKLLADFRFVEKAPTLALLRIIGASNQANRLQFALHITNPLSLSSYNFTFFLIDLWGFCTKQNMANAFSTLANGKKPLSGVLVISLIYAVYKAKQQFKINLATKTGSTQQQQKKKHKKVGVNAEFFEQMKKLLPICVPGIWQKATRSKCFNYWDLRN